ncbi:iripin-1-like isoform X1 [Dermacentor variabilis]|uniref:iripin-1-like isoform X1 n=2 Tax=Dermacentor variabilis TaxID=34621 RepID=UPI003F5CA6FD
MRLLGTIKLVGKAPSPGSAELHALRRKLHAMNFLICLAGLLALCAAQEEHKVTGANNQFGFKLLDKIPVSPQVNLFYSPYSVSTAMAMAYVGARGETQHDLHETLGYSSVGLTPDHVPSAHAQHTHLLRAPSNSTLRVANAAVVQDGYVVTEEYLGLLRTSFGAEVNRAGLNDEQSVRGINDWVKNKTEGKIEQLLSEPLPPNTRLVLLNAIYFKGLWNTPFEVRGTSKAQFFNAGTERVEVDTMHAQLNAGLAEDDETNADVLDLPYAGLDYSMTIVLPRVRNGVDALRQNLSWPVFQRLLSKLNAHAVVEVALPKFKIEGSYKLKAPLSALGASKAFDERLADFSGISGSRDLVVYEVVHKAVVEVNEEGSEAAAATGVITYTKSATFGIPFVVDHPFLFFIRNRQTGDVLFAGQVNHL